jgi:hypothetical protein
MNAIAVDDKLLTAGGPNRTPNGGDFEMLFFRHRLAPFIMSAVPRHL